MEPQAIVFALGARIFPEIPPGKGKPDEKGPERLRDERRMGPTSTRRRPVKNATTAQTGSSDASRYMRGEAMRARIWAMRW